MVDLPTTISCWRKE